MCGEPLLKPPNYHTATNILPDLIVNIHLLKSVQLASLGHNFFSWQVIYSTTNERYNKYKTSQGWDSFGNKVSLQTSMERNFSNFSYISFFCVNFKNLTIEFHVFMFLTYISNFVQI